MVRDLQGRVWTLGSNQHGQLGTVNSDGGLLPNAAFDGRRVVGVAAGSEHCLALCEGGGVWAWGWGEHGMVGDGALVDARAPVLVVKPRERVGVAAGAGFSIAW